MKKLFAVVLLCLLSEIAWSQNSRSTYNIGETVNYGNRLHFRIEKAGKWTSDNEYLQPDAGGFFYSVLVYIKNIGSESESYSLFNCHIKDSRGYQYEPTMGGPDPGLAVGYLNSGEIVRGYACFELPRSAKGLSLVYLPTIWCSTKIIVKLDQ